MKRVGTKERIWRSMIKGLRSRIWMQEDHLERLLWNYADAVCLKRNRNNSKTRSNRAYVYTKLFVVFSCGIHQRNSVYKCYLFLKTCYILLQRPLLLKAWSIYPVLYCRFWYKHGGPQQWWVVAFQLSVREGPLFPLYALREAVAVTVQLFPLGSPRVKGVRSVATNIF